MKLVDSTGLEVLWSRIKSSCLLQSPQDITTDVQEQIKKNLNIKEVTTTFSVSDKVLYIADDNEGISIFNKILILN